MNIHHRPNVGASLLAMRPEKTAPLCRWLRHEFKAKNVEANFLAPCESAPTCTATFQTVFLLKTWRFAMVELPSEGSEQRVRKTTHKRPVLRVSSSSTTRTFSGSRGRFSQDACHSVRPVRWARLHTAKGHIAAAT